MLKMFGAELEYGEGFAAIAGAGTLRAQKVVVPGDFSAAAFFIVGAALLEGSEIEIAGVGLNPTRTGLLEVLQEMGANLEIIFESQFSQAGEPIGRVRVRGDGSLRGCSIGGRLIPRLIDELPVLCVAAACAEGETTIHGAEELRVKESDRISAMAEVLKELGADVEELPDGLTIRGVRRLGHVRIDSRGDHRIAMAAAVAGLAGEGAEVEGAECIATSYPGFAEDLRQLGAAAEMIE
jgi:3-phosphoshikimate 1-carboxyvinyltransferase